MMPAKPRHSCVAALGDRVVRGSRSRTAAVARPASTPAGTPRAASPHPLVPVLRQPQVADVGVGAGRRPARPGPPGRGRRSAPISRGSSEYMMLPAGSRSSPGPWSRSAARGVPAGRGPAAPAPGQPGMGLVRAGWTTLSARSSVSAATSWTASDSAIRWLATDPPIATMTATTSAASATGNRTRRRLASSPRDVRCAAGPARPSRRLRRVRRPEAASWRAPPERARSERAPPERALPEKMLPRRARPHHGRPRQRHRAYLSVHASATTMTAAVVVARSVMASRAAVIVTRLGASRRATAIIARLGVGRCAAAVVTGLGMGCGCCRRGGCRPVVTVVVGEAG